MNEDNPVPNLQNAAIVDELPITRIKRSLKMTDAAHTTPEGVAQSGEDASKLVAPTEENTVPVDGSTESRRPQERRKSNPENPFFLKATAAHTEWITQHPGQIFHDPSGGSSDYVNHLVHCLTVAGIFQPVTQIEIASFVDNRKDMLAQHFGVIAAQAAEANSYLQERGLPPVRYDADAVHFLPADAMAKVYGHDVQMEPAGKLNESDDILIGPAALTTEIDLRVAFSHELFHVTRDKAGIHQDGNDDEDIEEGLVHGSTLDLLAAIGQSKELDHASYAYEPHVWVMTNICRVLKINDLASCSHQQLRTQLDLNYGADEYSTLYEDLADDIRRLSSAFDEACSQIDAVSQEQLTPEVESQIRKKVTEIQRQIKFRWKFIEES